MVVHHIPPPSPENPWTLIALYVPFTLSVSTTPPFHFVSKNFLETEVGEALNDKEIYLTCDSDPKQPGAQLIHSCYLKSDRRAQLVNPVNAHSMKCE